MISLIRFVFGFVAAMLTAGAVQVLFVAGADLLSGLPAARVQSLGLLTLLAATQSAVFSAPFAALAAVVAAWAPIRSVVYFVAAGAVIALAGFFAQYVGEAGPDTILNRYALAAYSASGGLGGLVYWLLAAPRIAPSTPEKAA